MRAAILLLTASALFAAAPTPESHFGHPMGQDRKLIGWARTVSYFQALDRASDRVLVRDLGKTTEGRPFIAAWISSPANLAKLDRYRDIQQRLADPRRTNEAEAARLIAEGKTVVMITCSIHSTEVASTLTAVDFAHRIAANPTPKMSKILDDVIFILVPSLNPDGVDIVADWYNKTLGTPHEGTSPPQLYQKYVGHDNNRDWYIFSQAETRIAISELHNVWHPQIVYDVHQQGPNGSRIFIPPWLDPIEPNIDPAIMQMGNMIGTGMAADLTAAGKKGVVINAIYDFWTPARHYQAFHGGMRILSESASVKLATPVKIDPGAISQSGNGYNPRESSWNHLEPWLGGEWKLRDIIDYQSIAWESCLWQAAVRREDLLRNFYRVHQRAVATNTPGAFLISKSQRDPDAARQLLDTLTFGQVEIEDSPRGYVVRTGQPYGRWAKALLEKQRYPDLRLYPGGPPQRPYDVTAHTLPVMMGVDVQTVDAPPGKLARVNEFRFEGPGTLAASDGNTWKEVNRTWAAGRSVWRDPATGNFSASARPGWTEKRAPRVAIYRSEQPSMDEGWTRWFADRFGLAFTSLRNREILAGNLRAKYDAILFPDQSPGSIHNGYAPNSMPAEYTGGLGDAGAKELIAFAQAGGTLVFMNRSSDYAIGHLGVPAKNVLRGLSSREFYSPGSLLAVKATASHPLLYGLPDTFSIWSEASPAWEPGPGAKSILNYPASGILTSGWLLGEKHLAGKSALIEAPMGSGRAILFGMRPQYRAQTYLTLKLLWNSMLR